MKWENEIMQKASEAGRAMKLAAEAAGGLICGVDPDKSDKTRIAEARKRVDDANDHYSAGNYDACARSLSWAKHYALTSNPAIRQSGTATEGLV